MEQRSEESGRRGGFFMRLGMGWGGLAGFLACLLAGTCAAANVGEVKWEFKPAGGGRGFARDRDRRDGLCGLGE